MRLAIGVGRFDGQQDDAARLEASGTRPTPSAHVRPAQQPACERADDQSQREDNVAHCLCFGSFDDLNSCEFGSWALAVGRCGEEGTKGQVFPARTGATAETHPSSCGRGRLRGLRRLGAVRRRLRRTGFFRRRGRASCISKSLTNLSSASSLVGAERLDHGLRRIERRSRRVSGRDRQPASAPAAHAAARPTDRDSASRPRRRASA